MSRKRRRACWRIRRLRKQSLTSLYPCRSKCPSMFALLVSNQRVPCFRCQVLYDYTPQHVDELEIHVGDIVNILEKCDDGWYCGIMDQCVHGNNMKFGTFPGNYVKILPNWSIDLLQQWSSMCFIVFCFYFSRACTLTAIFPLLLLCISLVDIWKLNLF